MYPGDGWVAIVRRTVIEVYVLRDGCPTYWKKISLPYVVGTAAFSQAMAPSPLRVCITSTPSIYVYGIEVNIAEGQLTKVDLWHYHDQTPLRPNIYPAPTCGQLGVTSNNVSWLEGNLCDSATPARFCTSSLNNHRGNPRIFGWYDDKAPMLSVLGVYDFDESRGILALGNALGELSIVDFSKSDPTWFSECSINPLKPIKYTGQKLLPVVSCVHTTKSYMIDTRYLSGTYYVIFYLSLSYIRVLRADQSRRTGQLDENPAGSCAPRMENKP